MQKIRWTAAALGAAALGLLAFKEFQPDPAITVSRAQLPVYFEPWGAPGNYRGRGAGFALELGAMGANIELTRGMVQESLTLLLEGGAPRSAHPENRLPGVSNYFLGKDPGAWRIGVPHYGRIRYPDVYPGVDLVYHGVQGALEYDFEVAPGVDPAQIRVQYGGARGLGLDGEGNLRIMLRDGELVHHRPVSYQLIEGVRHIVDSAFRLTREAGRDIVSFELGKYDVRLPLTIDPVLTYATYLGGTNDNERIDSLVADAAGALYIAGQTNSVNFPVTAGAVQPTLGGGFGFDAFIAKLNPAGTAYEYVTYLGGSGTEESHALRVDAGGNAFLAGSTTSANFPATAGAAQTTFGGASDAFVAKLNATGGALLYATYLGGSGGEPSSSRLGGFEIDVAGDAYVYGDTTSINFPTTAGAPQTTRGNPNGAQFDEDVFLTRINAAGTALTFSSYHGGAAIDSTNDTDIDPRLLAINDSGIAWIAGTSESADLPTTAGAFDTTFNGPAGGTPGGGDAFVARFDTSAGTRSYSTYVGGTADEFAIALTVDGAGSAYLASRTQSSNFPVTAGAPDATYGGGTGDAAIVKLNTAGSALAYGTYIGGGLSDSPEQVRVDSSGSLFVAGNTSSANFPATAGAADSTHNGGFDGFIARLNPAGNAFQYVTFVGSSDENSLFLMETDAAGSVYAVLEDATGDAPITAGGRAYAGDLDDYMVKLNPAGSAFLDASYLGGTDDDGVTAIAVDALENLYIAGITSSLDYPVTAGAPQPVKAGAASAEDTYIARFSTTPAAPVAQPGTLSLSAATYSVAEGAGIAQITVTRTGGSSGAVSASCSAASGGSDTATAAADYTAATSTLNWADGDAANKTCSVSIGNDTTDEPDETFTVTLSNATGGASLGAITTATVTITDDDAAPVPQPGSVQFNPASYSVNENGGSVTLTLTRTLGADGAISVSVATGGGSASSGSDYTALAQTVSWAAGDSANKTVALAIADDTADETDETVSVTLSNAQGGATLGTATASITIVDNDLPVVPPGPVTQASSVQGKYGGGSLDALLLGALALLVLATIVRRRAARRVLLAALAAAAGGQASAAEGWYAGVRAGVAETTQQATDIERSLRARGHDVTVTLDDRHPNYSLFGGYQWRSGLAVEMALVEIGEFAVEVDGTTSNASALLSDTQSLLADAGRAVSASLAYAIRLGERTELTPRVGAYYWESKQSARSEAGRLHDREYGVDLTAGMTLSLRLNEQWSLGLGYEAWAANERNDIRAILFEMRWTPASR